MTRQGPTRLAGWASPVRDVPNDTNFPIFSPSFQEKPAETPVKPWNEAFFPNSFVSTWIQSPLEHGIQEHPAFQIIFNFYLCRQERALSVTDLTYTNTHFEKKQAAEYTALPIVSKSILTNLLGSNIRPAEESCYGFTGVGNPI